MEILEWETYNRKEEEFHTNWLRPVLQPFVSTYHSHSYSEIMFVEKGEGEQQINGRHQVMEKGDLLVLRPNRDAHCVSSIDDDFSIMQIAVQEESINFIMDRYFHHSTRLWETKNADPTVFKLNEKQQEWYKSVFFELQRSERTLLKVEKFLLELIDILSDPHSYYPPGDESDWVQIILRQVVNPEVFSKGPKGLCDVVNKSQEHISRELRKRLGKTPSEIINEARIDYAKRELIFSEKEIFDIAMDCGFGSLSQFYNVFVTSVHISPGKYRKQNRS